MTYRRLRALLLMLGLSLPGAFAWADMDHAAEARDAAERAEAARQQAAKDRETQALRDQTEIKAYRAMLGARAVGKSDAEVRAMYKTYMADVQGQAARQMQQTPTPTQMEAGRKATRNLPANEQLMRQYSGGKSLDELANMSDAEIDALARRAAASAARR